MKIGLATVPSDEAIAPDVLARAAEERGFYSLLVSEHTHIPATTSPPFPGGGPLPREYLHCCDPFTWLAFAAAATTELRVGTGVCLVAQHDPIALAKRVATLDHLSQGRFEFGIGYGYNLDELRNHGVDPRSRRAVVREKVLAMQRLWSQEVADFTGEFVSIAPSWSWPKPAQRPWPPVLLGAAAGPGAFGHIVEFCDGWMMHTTIDRRQLEDLRAAAFRAGRNPRDLVVGVHRVDADRKTLDSLRGLDIDFVTLTVDPGPESDMLRQLDKLALLSSSS